MRSNVTLGGCRSVLSFGGIMRHTLIWLALFASLASAGCDSPRAEAKNILASSTSLRYVTWCAYLDGGSISFVFTNQASKEFVVFVPNPGNAQGVIDRGGRKIQRVLIAASKEFASAEPLELPVHSRAETKVSRLVQTALQESLPDERREEIYSLLEILAERTFDWDTFQKGYSEHIPRGKGRPKPNLAVEPTRALSGASGSP